MIVEEFSIESDERLEQFENCLKDELKSSSLRKPVEQTGPNSYAVSLRCDLTDVQTLERMINEWNKIDTQAISNARRPMKSLSNFFKFSKS